MGHSPLVEYPNDEAMGADTDHTATVTPTQLIVPTFGLLIAHQSLLEHDVKLTTADPCSYISSARIITELHQTRNAVHREHSATVVCEGEVNFT